MYQTLFTEIQNTLDKCDTIASTYNHPTADVGNEYPAVVYFPDDIDNSFATVKDNNKVYGFKMYVIVNAESDQKTMNQIFSEILADAVDDVIDQFDADWDKGRIDSHRITYLIDSGFWGVSEVEGGKEAFAELSLRIKVNTST